MTGLPVTDVIKALISSMYRCATCGEQMEQAVITNGKSYHPDHLPETPESGALDSDDLLLLDRECRAALDGEPE